MLKLMTIPEAVAQPSLDDEIREKFFSWNTSVLVDCDRLASRDSSQGVFLGAAWR